VNTCFSRSSFYLIWIALGVFANGAVKGEPVSKSGNTDLWGFQALVLLNDPLIQHELGLPPRQLDGIQTLTNAYFDALKAAFANLKSTSEQPKDKQLAALADFRRQREAIAADFDGVAVDALTAAQSSRLQQVAMQLRGLGAFQNTRLIEELELTQAQQAEIADIAWRTAKAAKPALQQRARGDITQERVKVTLAELDAGAVTAVVQSLRSDQKRKLDDLRGPAVSFDKNSLKLTMSQRPATDTEK
jgi:hypothetical protein